MANNIFQDVGKAIGSPIGNLVQGAYRGLAPGVYEQEALRRQGAQGDQRMQELQQKLMFLQRLQGSPAQAEFARNIMEQYFPEIEKMQQGAYQGAQDTLSTTDWRSQRSQEAYKKYQEALKRGDTRSATYWQEQAEKWGIGRKAEDTEMGQMWKKATDAIGGGAGGAGGVSGSTLPPTPMPAPQPSAAVPQRPTGAAEYGKDLFNMYGTVLGPSAKKEDEFVNKGLPKAPRDETDFAIWKDVRGKWYKLPVSLREEIRAALSEINPNTGKKYSWSEIVADETVSAELAKIK